jgi:GAF domain-containing protein
MSGDTAADVRDRGGDDDLASLLSSFVTLLPIEDAAASTLRKPFDVETLVASSARAAELDEAQIDLGEGPAWDALRVGRPVQLRLDVAKDRAAWPFLTAVPAVAGLRFVVSVPLSFGPLGIGAVTLSSSGSVTFGSEQFRLAETLATVLGRAVITRALSEAAAGAIVRDPSLSRREVHQATGMVIAQMRSTPEDALLTIRAHAFSRGVSVRSVAADIVARRLDFTSDHLEDRK